MILLHSESLKNNQCKRWVHSPPPHFLETVLRITGQDVKKNRHVGGFSRLELSGIELLFCDCVCLDLWFSACLVSMHSLSDSRHPKDNLSL